MLLKEAKLCGFPLPQNLQAARPRFWGDGSLSFEMSVIIHIIIGDPPQEFDAKGESTLTPRLHGTLSVL